MRVLQTKGSIAEDWVPRLCTHRGEPYAILSHRWFKDANREVLFADIQEIDHGDIDMLEGSDVYVVKNAQYANGASSGKPGFKKLQGAARQALKDGYDFIWIDTCCIDKSSSAELSEAINSMFRWYRASEVCYVYLVDVSDATDTSEGSPFAKSQWWKRGWTLQELLAPSKVTFFTQHWKVIGHKESLGTIIAGIAGINADVFGERRNIERFSIAQRMSWASGRITTRPEDIAYCLMGLFDVNMPVLYGEGEMAFIRLQQEIIKESDDESIFAWRDEPINDTYSGMLATRPAAFVGSQDVDYLFSVDNRPPHIMTNRGLSITLPLYRQGRNCIALLKCYTGQTEHRVGILLKQAHLNGNQYARMVSQEWIAGKAFNYHEISPIFVRQYWDDLRGFQSIFQMKMDTNNSNSPTLESQGDVDRHESNNLQIPTLQNQEDDSRHESGIASDAIQFTTPFIVF